MLIIVLLNNNKHYKQSSQDCLLKGGKTMMKRFISMFLFVSLFVGSHAHALSIQLTSSDYDISVGESFTVDVIATGIFDNVFFDELIAFGFDVTVLNPSLIAYNGATVNSIFWDDSASFMNTDVAGSVFPGITDNQITLASLGFTATSAGMTTLGVFSDLSDFNEGLIYAFNGPVDLTTNLEVSIASNSAPIPEPATMLLMGTGIVGLIGARRKKKQK
jgi:hypothetical protein